MKRCDEVGVAFEQAVARDPSSSEAQLPFGTYCLIVNDLDRTEEHLNLALRDPEKRDQAQMRLQQLANKRRRQ